jgi:hypothetical protein
MNDVVREMDEVPDDGLFETPGERDVTRDAVIVGPVLIVNCRTSKPMKTYPAATTTQKTKRESSHGPRPRRSPPGFQLASATGVQ